jgi:uncharacterized coiled-coil protein SlyX
MLRERNSRPENEVEGEKAVTRHVLEHARLNGDDLAAMRAQLAHLADDMVLVKSTLNSHGMRLNVLTQDVGLLRQDVEGLRRIVNETRQEMRDMRHEMRDMRQEMGDMREEMRREFAAIRVALAPSPP